MDNISLLSETTSEIGTSIGIHKGFPNPAAERDSRPLSLDRLLVHSPSSTYYFRIRGHGWNRLGIYDGDIAIVDRSLSPAQGKLIIWCDEFGELCIGHWSRSVAGQLWGVITAVIHQYNQSS